MTSQKDIAKKQAEIVGQLQQFPIGRTNSGGRAGGTVEVVITNPLPGQPRVVQAKCANDCPPGDVQIIKADDGSYVALSPNAARSTGETTTRQVSKKNPVKPKKDEEIWPCTVAFLYSRIKPNMEDLTDNGLATGDETSWDWNRFSAYSSSDQSSVAYVFGQQFTTLGDYLTGPDALNNILKPDRLITPAGGSGGSKDDLVAGSGSADAVTVWFYIGQLQGSGTTLAQAGNGQIFRVGGRSSYPGNENTEQGPGFCMEMYRQGSIAVSLYPIVQIGKEPLTRHLSASFPGLGGKIGYWGYVYKWRGMQDYTHGSGHYTYLYRSYWSEIAGRPNFPNEPIEVPTSFSPEWQEGVSNYSPWKTEHSTWYRFGWDNQTIAAMSAGAIVANVTALTNSSFVCGGVLDNDQWYWGHGIGSSAGALDKRADYSFAEGMFVCWQGHKDNIGLATSFWEAFRTYWNIPGTVTKLRSCNLFGCELPGGGGYPPAPPSAPAQRYLARYWGRKAEIYLKVHRQNDEPIELKLPIEFAACVEKVEVIGGGSFSFGANFESSKSANRTRTFSQMLYYEDPFALELIHGTLAIDAEFAYVDVFCGGDRIWEDPLTNPLPSRLGNLGFGGTKNKDNGQRRISVMDNLIAVNTPFIADYANTPRVVKDCFGACHSFKVKLPTKDDKTVSIVAYQKYKRGENIALTAANPENEFNNKFLICDLRTDTKSYVMPQSNPSNLRATTPDIEYASFGGLPALVQTPYYGPNDVHLLQPRFYKEPADWTEMDWLYWQLQEGPRQFNPLNTVLPPGVSAAQNTVIGVYFEFDKKFGRHARAEVIVPASSFGYAGTYGGGYSPDYSSSYLYREYILFTSFSEQLRGNGVKENGILSKWFRVSTSSFPVHGQLTRNTR